MRSPPPQAGPRRRQYRRHIPPTVSKLLSASSALPSPTSDQSSIPKGEARESLTSVSSSGSNSSSNNNSNNNFIQQNPRYSSLWLQKCLLPRHLSPSTLTGAAPHHLNPDCYPYPNMADSVDRVFVHALHTVKRLPRTGSLRPPERDRLALYGLYKQATEGDVAGLLPPYRRNGTSKEDVAEREKWDAWAAVGGLGKTEAKRQYIEVLIATMRRYAMGTVEARELVGELEFVWGQIRGGSGGSLGLMGGGEGDGKNRRRRGEVEKEEEEEEYRDGSGGGRIVDGEHGLRVLRPMSEGDEVENDDDGKGEEHEEDDDDDDEEFQDPDQGSILDGHVPPTNNREAIPHPTSPTSDILNRKWRHRISLALNQLSVEIAALRETIEHQTPSSIARARIAGGGILAWAKWLITLSLQHVLIDGAILLLLVIWAKRKGDQRLERGLLLFWYWVREKVERMGSRVRVRVRLGWLGALERRVRVMMMMRTL